MARNHPNRAWLIDHDGGVDDAAAIMCALHNVMKSNDEIVCFTTVSGNVDAEQARQNTRLLLKEFASHLSIPVYAGCTEPMVQRKRIDAWPGHGTDGMGNAPQLNRPNNADDVHDFNDGGIRHGVDALVHHINKNPNCTIVALGPLTNIAMALKMDPNVRHLIGKLYVMGGSLTGRGNSSMAAEFNFHCDPEAAHVVVSSFDSATLCMITWDLTEQYSLSWQQFDELAAITTNAAQFLIRICRKYERLVRHAGQEEQSPPPQKKRKLSSGEMNFFVLCDLYAMAVAFYPHMVAQEEHHYGEVELTGNSRGFLAIDWYDRQKATKNICAITQLQTDAIFNLLKLILNEIDNTNNTQ